MEIRYLDLTALIVAIISVLMVGCAIDSGDNLIIIEEPEAPPAEPVPIEAPTEVVVEEAPEQVDEEPLTEPAIEEASPERETVSNLLAKKPADKTEWLTGVVIGVISTRPRYTVGEIREDKTLRKYKFTTDIELQRWTKISFRIDQTDKVVEIISTDADNDGVPDVQVRNYGTSIKGYEDGLRIMEGTLAKVRHDRKGKTYGIIKVHDGSFKTYGFDTYDYFKNGDRVRFKMDMNNNILEMEII